MKLRLSGAVYSKFSVPTHSVKRSHIYWCTLILLLTFYPASNLLAEVVRHEFSGTITALRLSSDNPLIGQLQVGDSFSGFYEFDSSQSPSIGSVCQDDLLQCKWEFLIPPNQFSISVGPFNALVSQRYNIRINNGVVQNGNLQDFYVVETPDGLDFNGLQANTSINLLDDSRTAIDDPRVLFTEPPNPDDFQSSIAIRDEQFQLNFPSFIDFIKGRIDRYVRVPIVTDVVIDIKPGSKRNVINPRSRGGVWVAILSDIDPETPFDPTSQVDITTVQFGPDGAEAIRHKVKDINKDGIGDLLLRFNIPETGIACGDTEATLIGETFAGISIMGTDAIETAGCK